MSFRVAFVGAGSIGFTGSIFADLMTIPEFRDIELALTDVVPQNLEMVTELIRKDLKHNDIELNIISTTDRREALKGAKYIINCIRVGGLEGFETDIEIPLKYGVDQAIGDTLCVGGIMYGQRIIAALLDICKDIREVSLPGAILLNYSNPNAMATWACNKYGGVKTIGLCHGEMCGEEDIAKALGIPLDELDFICAGINHQTWYISIKHNGEEIKQTLLDACLKSEEMLKEEKVRIDMLKRFGHFSTESNGHLSEYLAWYRKRPESIMDWIDMDCWISGQTAGYLKLCKDSRSCFEKDYENILAGPAKTYDPKERGREHGSYIIEALETGRTYRGHFNVMNHGCITNLPDECVVEVPCYVDKNGISTPQIGDLPLGCAAVCSQSIWVQRLAVEAAVTGDDTLLKQAALMDPLTGAVCTPPEVWQMIDEMLVVQEQWLPQYTNAILDAKARIAAGNLIPTKDGYKGAARLPYNDDVIAEEDKELLLGDAMSKMK